MSSTSEVFQSTFNNLLGTFSGGTTPPEVKELDKMFANMSINSPPKSSPKDDSPNTKDLINKLSKMKIVGSPSENIAKPVLRPEVHKRFAQPFVPVVRHRPAVPRPVTQPAVHPRFVRPIALLKKPRLSPIIEESPPKETKRQRSPMDDSNLVKKKKINKPSPPKSAATSKRQRQSPPKPVSPVKNQQPSPPKPVSPVKNQQPSPPKSAATSKRQRQSPPKPVSPGKRQKFNLDDLASSLPNLDNSNEPEAKPGKPASAPPALRKPKTSAMMIDPSRRSTRSTTKPDRFTPGEVKKNDKTKSAIKKDDKKKKAK
jgi:hypothetical protein